MKEIQRSLKSSYCGDKFKKELHGLLNQNLLQCILEKHPLRFFVVIAEFLKLAIVSALQCSLLRFIII